MKGNYRRIFLLILFAGALYFGKYYREFLPQSEVVSIRPLEHMWGQPAKSMFPEISSPEYLPASKAAFLKDDDLVYVKDNPDVVYVYPAMILAFHHIVNDTEGLFPSAVTLCLLTDTAVSYSRMVEGKFLDFAVLGPLYYGNLVMYDKKSDSYWHQLTGESFEGKYSGWKLKQDTKIYKTAWKNVRNKNNLKILPMVNEEKFYRDFYSRYNDSVIGLQSLKGKKEIDKRLMANEKGYALVVNGESKFYPAKEFSDNNVRVDTVGGIRIKISYEKDKNIFLAYRIYDPVRRWLIPGLREQINVIPSYWYSWAAFYPDTTIYRLDE